MDPNVIAMLILVAEFAYIGYLFGRTRSRGWND